MPSRPVLERVCLHRPELRAWAMYDWGNSAFFTTIVATVFPIYFAAVAAPELDAAAATRMFMRVTVVALALIAITAPVLGAAADVAGRRKRLLGVFLATGVSCTGAMFFVDSGDWVLGAVLFAGANISAAGTLVFYDALLPHVARPDEIDRLSTSAYALGYLGGGLLLAAQLLFMQKPEWFGLADSGTLPVRLTMLSVAVWWLLFALPLLLRVKEPPARVGPGAVTMRASLQRLVTTLRDLRARPQALMLLLAYFVYADGIGTVFRVAGVYSNELGFSSAVILGAILLTQFVGVPAAFVFGWLSTRIGAKRSIMITLVTYVGVCLFGSQMSVEWHLFVLAGAIACVQGGAQALSRSLFASMIPPERSGEFFGLFAVFEKVGGVGGPLLFLVVSEVAREWVGDAASRFSVAAISVLFVIGAYLLSRVDVEAGRAAVAAESPRPAE